MKAEIGSEFHYEELNQGKNESWNRIINVCDSAFVFSGRTAIETILLNVPHVRKAMLPSYCCESMLEPFHKAGISCVFYDVNFKDGIDININMPEDVELLLWCNYFGFQIKMPDFSEFIHRGGVIVEDITHSFLSKTPHDVQSQYIVASLRKWGPLLSGGYCAIKEGSLRYKPCEKPSLDFLNQKKQAMNLKRDYISGNKDIDKRVFLSAFSESNKWIANNYSNLTMDEESKDIFRKLDWSEIIDVRKRNAGILYSGLKNRSSIKFLFDKEDMDCPLFVPIVVANGMRDCLRKTLTENNIYCPIHWPKPNEKSISNLYETELSLICDQRYDESDMQRIVEVISRWEDTKE